MHALLIDIGNTSLKIGVAGIEGLVASYTLPTDTQQSGDGLGLQLAYLLGHAGFGTPGTGPGNVALDGCVISSVVPGMNPLVAHACERFLELTPRFAHRDLPIPLENRYERPNEVGADRLVGAFGARRLLPDVRSVVSVDYGTATNFDCVTGNAYLGGLICPGVMSSLGALATRTAQLPRIALTAHADVPIVGRSTVTSLNHGFLFGFASMTDGLLCAPDQDARRAGRVRRHRRFCPGCRPRRGLLRSRPS